MIIDFTVAVKTLGFNYYVSLVAMSCEQILPPIHVFSM